MSTSRIADSAACKFSADVSRLLIVCSNLFWIAPSLALCVETLWIAPSYASIARDALDCEVTSNALPMFLPAPPAEQSMSTDEEVLTIPRSLLSYLQ
jgi:hypothetical protein